MFSAPIDVMQVAEIGPADRTASIIWEEILKRFPEIRVVGESTRTYSSFVHGFETCRW